MKNNSFLAIISGNALQDGTLSEEDIQKIQIGLYALLGQRVERYTMRDSSSVPVETAEELLKSICFSIELYVQETSSPSLLKTEDMEKLLKGAWRILEAQIAQGKEQLRRAKESAPKIKSHSYRDTLAGLGVFFKRYDYMFFAHDIPGEIDYQLCRPVPETLQGITYVREYLRRLILENEFCCHFDTETMILLLKSYSSDYTGLLVNIYEPVAVNAVGRVLLGKSVPELEITDADRAGLLAQFKTWTKAEAKKTLTAVAKHVCSDLKITDKEAQDYLEQTAAALYPRIETAVASNGLDGIFLSLYREPVITEPTIQYIDGDLMEDEMLQELISDISDCQTLPEKIALVKEKVHSLRDLAEVLNVCFWDEDCLSLFGQLGEAELDALRYFLEKKPKTWYSDSGWEKQLRKFSL